MDLAAVHSDSVDFINKDLTLKGSALVCKLISIPISINIFSDIGT